MSRDRATRTHGGAPEAEIAAESAAAKTTETRRFVSFLLVGAAAAGVNILSRVALNHVMRFEIAIIVAYICGMTTAYVLNRLFVFDASGRGITSEYLRFTLVNVAALAQVWIISVGLARLVPAIGFTWRAETVAHVIGVMIPVFTSYFGHKHFSFARKTERNDASDCPEKCKGDTKAI